MSFVGGVGYSNIDLIYSGLDRLPDKGEEIFARGFSMQFGGGIPATIQGLELSPELLLLRGMIFFRNL